MMDLTKGCALFMLIAMSFALYGWGAVCRRVLGLPKEPWPVTIVQGIGCVVFLGGILNLLCLAYPVTVGTVLATGLMASFYTLWRTWQNNKALPNHEKPVGESIAVMVVTVLASLVICFTLFTQLPTAAHNYHDDYLKYFTHPLRMLQTGTLAGNPIGSLGVETFGGQAFLHAFLAAWFPIPYINGVDAVIGLFLCLILASWPLNGGSPCAICAKTGCLLAVVFINPQVVNVSALYTGSALMMVVVWLCASNDPGKAAPRAVGMLYAALVALKTSFSIFVAVHLLFVGLGMFVWNRNFKQSGKWLLSTSAAAFFFLLPWLALHRARLVSLLGAESFPDRRLPDELVENFRWFSTDELQYGATIAHYSCLIVAMCVVALVAAWPNLKQQQGKQESGASSMTVVAAFSGLVMYGVMLLIASPAVAGHVHSVRYFTPFAIGMAPMIFGMSASQLSGISTNKQRYLKAFVPVIVLSVVIVPFWHSFQQRVNQAVKTHNTLAFRQTATSPYYLNYCLEQCGNSMRENIKHAQASVPIGEPIIAWVTAPFHFDYGRNPICLIEAQVTRVNRVDLSRVRYVAWSAYSPGALGAYNENFFQGLLRDPGKLMRIAGWSSLVFVDQLQRNARRGEVIFNQNGVVVFRLPTTL